MCVLKHPPCNPNACPHVQLLCPMCSCTKGLRNRPISMSSDGHIHLADDRTSSCHDPSWAIRNCHNCPCRSFLVQYCTVLHCTAVLYILFTLNCVFGCCHSPRCPQQPQRRCLVVSTWHPTTTAQQHVAVSTSGLQPGNTCGAVPYSKHTEDIHVRWVGRCGAQWWQGCQEWQPVTTQVVITRLKTVHHACKCFVHLQLFHTCPYVWALACLLVRHSSFCVSHIPTTQCGVLLTCHGSSASS